MPILTETFEGVPGGMNLALPAWELDDTEARYLQDILLDFPGLTRRRGPLSAASSATFSDKLTGLFYTYDPLGTLRIGALSGDNTKGNFEAIAGNLLTKQQIPWNQNMPNNPPTQPYTLIDTAPALKGGVMVGSSTAYNSTASAQTLALWRGGNKTNYTTGTISVARGSASVSGSGTLWAANAAPGMFLFANTDDPYTDTFIGVVSAVISDTALSLEQISPHPITARSYTLRSLRGIQPRIAKGRLTCNTASAVATGGTTKFTDQGMGTGTWQVYRASDFAFVGKVTTVSSNISITFTANAAVAMANERFIAIKCDTFSNAWTTNNLQSTQKVGWITSVYAERQWYANNGLALDKTARVWFSDTADLEALDLSTFDGDFINIGSTQGALEPIQALQAAYNALLIFKESEVYGVFGTSPTNFSVKKLADDGALSGGSVQAWAGGVIWAGREGINYFDGINVTNLAQPKLGDYWKNSLRTFVPANYRMYSAVIRDHYLLHIENVSPTVAVVKGNTSTNLNKLTVVVNMNTRSFTMFTNVGFRGALELPLQAGGAAIMSVNGTSGGNNRGWIADAKGLWDSEGVDGIQCDGDTTGPDFYFESKKYNAGDSLRKKLFKQMAIHYLLQGGSLKLDTVTGLNNVGKTSLTTFDNTVYTWDTLSILFASWDALAASFPTWDALVNSVFIPKRIKFLKRSQFLSFRIWQTNANITRVRLGPFSIGYKLQRPGRI